jgi:hypothetical protein
MGYAITGDNEKGGIRAGHNFREIVLKYRGLYPDQVPLQLKLFSTLREISLWGTTSSPAFFKLSMAAK